MPKRRKRDALDYFRFDAVAWITSPEVTAMTAAQEGAFLRLLVYASRAKDCALPADDEILAKLSKLGDDWSTTGRLVRQQFVPLNGDGTRIINEKLHSEWRRSWSNYRARCKRNRENRLKGAPVVHDSSTSGDVKGKGTRKGKGVISVPTDNLPAAAGAPLAQAFPSKRAVDVFRRHYPDGEPSGSMFKALRPLVQKHGWEKVEPELDAYLAVSEVQFHSWQKFAAGFGSWATPKRERGSQRAVEREAGIVAMVKGGMKGEQ